MLRGGEETYSPERKTTYRSRAETWLHVGVLSPELKAEARWHLQIEYSWVKTVPIE